MTSSLADTSFPIDVDSATNADFRTTFQSGWIAIFADLLSWERVPTAIDAGMRQFCIFAARSTPRTILHRFTHVEPAAQATHRHSQTPTNVNRRTVKQDLPASPTEKNQQQQEETRKNASATERSQKKTCGICLEMVWRREVDPRFGLLENCDHVFCLECIRKWRSTSNYENTVVKAWFVHRGAKELHERNEEFDFVLVLNAARSLISSRQRNTGLRTTKPKQRLFNRTRRISSKAQRDRDVRHTSPSRKIHCKYFQRGDGVCPFGSKCFYRHVDQNGRTVELGPPRRRRRADARQELDHLSDFFIMSLLSAMDVEGLFDEYVRSRCSALKLSAILFSQTECILRQRRGRSIPWSWPNR